MTTDPNDEIDPKLLKKIQEAGLRKMWATSKANALKKIKAEDKEEAKEAEKIFAKGLGPEIDHFYKVAGGKKPDTKAMKKSHDKMISIVAQYKKEISGAAFHFDTTTVLLDSLKAILLSIAAEWKVVGQKIK